MKLGWGSQETCLVVDKLNLEQNGKKPKSAAQTEPT